MLYKKIPSKITVNVSGTKLKIANIHRSPIDKNNVASVAKLVRAHFRYRHGFPELGGKGDTGLIPVGGAFFF